MERDKLNEAAEEYAHENAWYPGETSYESDITAMQESFSDTFKAGADWLMTQPLADRLTDEEKEKIRALYNEYRAHVFHIEMEGIFGKDLFNDK